MEKRMKGYLVGGRFFDDAKKAISFGKMDLKRVHADMVEIAPVIITKAGNEVWMMEGAEPKKVIKQMHMKKLGKVI